MLDHTACPGTTPPTRESSVGETRMAATRPQEERHELRRPLSPQALYISILMETPHYGNAATSTWGVARFRCEPAVRHGRRVEQAGLHSGRKRQNRGKRGPTPVRHGSARTPARRKWQNRQERGPTPGRRTLGYGKRQDRPRRGGKEDKERSIRRLSRSTLSAGRSCSFPPSSFLP